MKRILLAIPFLALYCAPYTVQALPATEHPLPNDVVAEAAKGGYQLIAPDELAREYRENPASLLLIDTRQDWAFRMLHIDGAVHLSVTPSWWYQYSPFARSEIRDVLAAGRDKKLVFY